MSVSGNLPNTMNRQYFDLNEEFSFWQLTFTEHCEFISQLLDASKSPAAAEFKVLALKLKQSWQGYKLNFNDQGLQTLVTNLASLKIDILRARSQGVDLGFISKSLLLHMIEELNFFDSLVNGTMTPEKELNFWLHENADHTNLAAHLIEPRRKLLTDTVLNLSKQIESSKIQKTPTMNDQEIMTQETINGLPVDTQTIDLNAVYNTSLNMQDLQTSIDDLQTSNNSAGDLLQNLMADPSLALLKPEMLQHEINETNYGIERLRKIVQMLSSQFQAQGNSYANNYNSYNNYNGNQ
jgi:hypothetical protein